LDEVGSGSKVASGGSAREALRVVKIFVGVTHKPWFDYLATLAPDEVNFWQPSGSGEFKALRPGDLFLFKLKAPWNAIAGGAVFEHASLAPLSLAWEAFGTANGNRSLADMRSTISRLRRSAPIDERDDPTIGCRILTQPFFWPDDRWIPVPPSFAANTVVGRGYSTADADGLALWKAVQDRLAGDQAAPRTASGDRFGKPTLMQRRLGQGAFRLAVTDGYSRRCAVSGEKTLPILDAARIRSYASGGEHDVSNGLLLRTDIHKLFDRGFVTVTDDLRFAVSERLKADFDNGVHYYAMQGREIASPRRGFAPPSQDALRWHRENRYLG
jgi:putative restriction endonuclease